MLITNHKVPIGELSACVASKASAIEHIAKEQFDAIPAEYGKHSFEHCLRVWRHYANNLTVHAIIDDDDGGDDGEQNGRDKINEDDLEELV
jgi:inosine/xanthosine triphosphate pyrophosphatase family protein